jgi:HEPN domain
MIMLDSRFDEIDDVQCEINCIIKDSYVDSADQDYIVARWAYLNEFYSNFCWSAAQCIEKYLKSILLFHNIAVCDLGHNLVKTFDRVEKKCPDIIIDEFYDVPGITNMMCIKCSSDTPRNYIRGLNDTGDPDIRYLQIHHSVDWTDLMKLDQLVFSLRKYCKDPTPWQPHPDHEPDYLMKTAQSAKNWSDIRWTDTDGLLHKLRQEFTDQDSLKSDQYHFLLLNVPFEGFTPAKANVGWTSRTSALRRVMDRLEGQVADTFVEGNQCHEVLRWVLEKMGLSHKLKSQIKIQLDRSRETP